MDDERFKKKRNRTMLRVSAQRLAGEFTQKSRWARVQPTMYYGRLYLPWNSYRTFPMKSVNWVTRDSNRLVNFTSRYQIVRDELDVAKNEEDLKIPLNDVRWNDNRRIHMRKTLQEAAVVHDKVSQYVPLVQEQISVDGSWGSERGESCPA